MSGLTLWPDQGSHPSRSSARPKARPLGEAGRGAGPRGGGMTGRPVPIFRSQRRRSGAADRGVPHRPRRRGDLRRRMVNRPRHGRGRERYGSGSRDGILTPSGSSKWATSTLRRPGNPRRSACSAPSIARSACRPSRQHPSWLSGRRVTTGPDHRCALDLLRLYARYLFQYAERTARLIRGGREDRLEIVHGWPDSQSTDRGRADRRVDLQRPSHWARPCRVTSGSFTPSFVRRVLGARAKRDRGRLGHVGRLGAPDQKVGRAPRFVRPRRSRIPAAAAASASFIQVCQLGPSTVNAASKSRGTRWDTATPLSGQRERPPRSRIVSAAGGRAPGSARSSAISAPSVRDCRTSRPSPPGYRRRSPCGPARHQASS